MLQLLLSFHSSSAMARSLQSVLAYDQYAGAAVVHGCKAGSWRYSAVELGVEVNCMLMVVAALRLLCCCSADINGIQLHTGPLAWQ